MAYKVFTNGSVLNASEVNDNLMNQAVITFTNSTARASAITSPVEGMVTYLADTDTYQFWNGSAWTNLVSSTVGTGNAIINGAFEINQRRLTSATSGAYGFDRWATVRSGGTITASSEAFTLGSPVAGFESANFQRTVVSGHSAVTDLALLTQPIEGVRSFAGETITVSFYAKAASGTPKIGVELYQQFGSGGSPSAAVSTVAGTPTISTSWARYTATIAVPGLTGKTIGTNINDALEVGFWFSAGSNFNSRSGSIGIQNNTFDIWGVQVEAGTSATPFRRNANSLAGELAACQRYYYRQGGSAVYETFAIGRVGSTTFAQVYFRTPVTLRTGATSVEFSSLILPDGSVGPAVTTLVINQTSRDLVDLTAFVASGLTVQRVGQIQANNSLNAFVAVSAEL